MSTDDTVEQIVCLSRVLTTARPKHRTHASLAEIPFTERDTSSALEDASGQEPEEPAPLTPSHTVPDDCPGVGMFVVSSRRGFRRLHRVGDCHLEPGVDYKDFRSLGAERPSSEHFDATCRWCFKSCQFEDVANSSSSDDSSS